jgi:crotonobetainyl-CoA:carnitine CoA-transferase CaiB-like acyl-CoA transferase
MDRLGIGYRTLSEINSKIIYCAISAFGQTGPEREAAGYDGKIQALSGIMAMTGHESTGPTRAGFAVCDVISGSTAAFAIAAALRQRDQTGKGQFIDVSMLEASLAFMSSQVADYTIADHVEKLSGNYSISRKPTANLLKAGSGSLLFAVNNEKQFRALMTALGRPDVISDPRFSNWKTRKENEKALVEIIEECLATKSASDWERLLDAAGAPCATVRRIDEILEHPQIRSREVLKTIDTPHGPLRLIATGFKLAHGDAEISSIAPGVGEHSAEVLEELGYSASEIAALAVSQII